ncbi:MAG: flagellar biosynthesis protein FlhB [Nitrospirales bacterium]|nr:flagellar biosynthesis protein FlhB [Nitrospirales bacterium]
MAEYEERTEQATPRRRQKAREEGQIARSRDLSSIAAIGGVLIILYLGGSGFMTAISRITGRLLSLQYGRDPFTVMRAASLDAMLLLAPFLAISFVLAIVANVSQGGIVLKPLKLNTDMLNPLNGIKRLFSLRGLMEFLKSLVKFAVGGYLVYWVVRKDIPALPGLMDMGIRPLATTSAALLMKALAYGFLWFFVLALIDYFLQRWQFERSLRMSKEEIKEEQKESDGNPMIKSRVRSLQREMARKRMMQEVPKATVVITNPTHLAVALKYEDGKMAAPKVIAKGANDVALRIKEIARQHGVPIVEDKPLARLLFKLDPGDSIPEDLYKAVAKILAYIYRLKGVA